MKLETHEQARVRTLPPLAARLAATPAKINWSHYVQEVKRDLVSQGDERLNALAYPAPL